MMVQTLWVGRCHPNRMVDFWVTSSVGDRPYGQDWQIVFCVHTHAGSFICTHTCNIGNSLGSIDWKTPICVTFFFGFFRRLLFFSLIATPPPPPGKLAPNKPASVGVNSKAGFAKTPKSDKSGAVPGWQLSKVTFPPQKNSTPGLLFGWIALLTEPKGGSYSSEFYVLDLC